MQCVCCCLVAWLLVTMVTLEVRGQQDRTRQARAAGSEVVENVVEQVRSSCVLPQDNMLLRRLAYVESRDGTDPNTYRTGYHGGIWQIDQDVYESTKTSPYLETLRQDIATHLGIDWKLTRWEDLDKPLFSGIASALHMSDVLKGSPHPITLPDQQSFWAVRYHTGRTVTPADFSTLVQLMTPGCRSQALLDLAFVLDTSASLSGQDFRDSKQFVLDVTSAFDLDTRNTRVALITYSSHATVRLDWDSTSSRAVFDATIQGLDYEPGSTQTADALNLARTTLFSRARPNAAKVLVIVTDGASQDSIDTSHAARALHALGDVLVLVVGVSDEVNQEELYSIASSPPCKHTFTVNAYGQIDALKEEIQQLTCRAPLIMPMNQTVQCAMCHCSPYVVDVPTAHQVVVEASTTCQGPVSLYSAFNTAYPSASLSQAALSITTSSPALLHVRSPATASASAARDGVSYYVNVDQTAPGACSTACTVTMLATIRDVRVVCVENGVQRDCSHQDLVDYAPNLLTG